MTKYTPNQELIEQNIHEYVATWSKYVLRDRTFYQQDEGYKYKAVETFQKHFNLDAKDLKDMFEKALKDAGNLVASGHYYPKQMLMQYVEQNSEFVRKAFKQLLERDDSPISNRIDTFIETINARFGEEGKNSYFDYRFVGFFLAAYNPREFISVKSSEFNTFAKKVGYDLNVTGSGGEKYRKFLDFAQIVQEILRSNQDFVRIHKEITEPFAYKDPSLSWGTTDFIFNVARRKEMNLDEEVKEKIKTNTLINEMKASERDDYYIDEEIVEDVASKNSEELRGQIHSYEPKGSGYVKKEGSFRARKDNSAQKERIRKIENYSCQICGFTFAYRMSNGKTRKFVHIDHIIEKNAGGTEAGDNLWALCPNCHAKKTLGVIIINTESGQIFENDVEIRLHHNNHLTWYV